MAIGKGATQYLEDLTQASDARPNPRERDYVVQTVAECQRLIRVDPDDGVQMLHILETVNAGGLGEVPKKAYDWANQQCMAFRKSGDKKLAGRYERLVNYFHESGYSRRQQ